MADAYIGEIRMFAGNFPPKDWAFCDGSLLPIQRNTALFSILGTAYGGNGTTTFALPNLTGHVPIGAGAGPGLTQRYVGEEAGSETVTLLATEMPVHAHSPMGHPQKGTTNDPTGAVWGEYSTTSHSGVTKTNLYSSSPNVQMAPQALGTAGNSQAHNNMQPYLSLNFIICMVGEFPPRG